MGRPSKNPNHPITRLRETLSLTRAQFAKRTGIPEVSLKAIECGTYKVTKEVAFKVSLATGVHPYCLLKDNDPLVDVLERPFSKNTRKTDYLASTDLFKDVNRQLLEAAMEAASKKERGRLLGYMFNQWLISTCQSLDLVSLVSEKLTERLGLFDPQPIPSEFRPKNRQMAQEWKTFEAEIDELEQIALSTDGEVPKGHEVPAKIGLREQMIKTAAAVRNAMNPQPKPASAEISAEKEALRVQREELVAQIVAAKTREQVRKNPKPEKQPRSASRKAA
jgi:transcriptional regulator with XRE-family HTH domain